MTSESNTSQYHRQTEIYQELPDRNYWIPSETYPPTHEYYFLEEDIPQELRQTNLAERPEHISQHIWATLNELSSHTPLADIEEIKQNRPNTLQTDFTSRGSKCKATCMQPQQYWKTCKCSICTRKGRPTANHAGFQCTNPDTPIIFSTRQMIPFTKEIDLANQYNCLPISNNPQIWIPTSIDYKNLPILHLPTDKQTFTLLDKKSVINKCKRFDEILQCTLCTYTTVQKPSKTFWILQHSLTDPQNLTTYLLIHVANENWQQPLRQKQLFWNIFKSKPRRYPINKVISKTMIDTTFIIFHAECGGLIIPFRIPYQGSFIHNRNLYSVAINTELENCLRKLGIFITIHEISLIVNVTSRGMQYSNLSDIDKFTLIGCWFCHLIHIPIRISNFRIWPHYKIEHYYESNNFEKSINEQYYIPEEQQHQTPITHHTSELNHSNRSNTSPSEINKRTRLESYTNSPTILLTEDDLLKAFEPTSQENSILTSEFNQTRNDQNISLREAWLQLSSSSSEKHTIETSPLTRTQSLQENSDSTDSTDIPTYSQIVSGKYTKKKNIKSTPTRNSISRDSISDIFEMSQTPSPITYRNTPNNMQHQSKRQEAPTNTNTFTQQMNSKDNQASLMFENHQALRKYARENFNQTNLAKTHQPILFTIGSKTPSIQQDRLFSNDRSNTINEELKDNSQNTEDILHHILNTPFTQEEEKTLFSQN